MAFKEELLQRKRAERVHAARMKRQVHLPDGGRSAPVSQRVPLRLPEDISEAMPQVGPPDAAAIYARWNAPKRAPR